jgi:polyribonucleotide nucleotidyltransferase
VRDEVAEALRIAGKAEREEALDRIKDATYQQVGPQFEGREKEVGAALRSLTKNEVRARVLREQVRIDGRGPRDIRPLTAEVQVLPRVHGSALFERGETQILGVTTLNMLRMEQTLDTLSPEKSKRYMHNYNFPPYSTGETGRVGAPKRREIGHGALAERALIPVLPAREEFPYAIRQVSEALGSNGSTSMGSVCASTMALLSAGVPLKAPVAGIAMGLISDEVEGKTEFVTLTDILGAEDAYGDMDFKVAGTRDFVTALQLDTKLDGIPSDVLAGALQQAHDARQVILDVMAEAIGSPAGMSQYAPRVTTVKIPVDKIGMVIGPKGQTINAIQDETGAEISIEDDGTIYVGATDGPSAEAAVERINAIANPTMPKVGDKFLGTVVKTAAFGAFVALLPGRDGLLHISKVGNGKRVERVEDFLNVGDKIEVQIADIDNRGKIYLDKVLAEGEEAPAPVEGGGRPSGRDRGDRGPRDRGDRGDRGERGERGPGRDRGDRGPRPASGERPASGDRPAAAEGGENPGDGERGDGEGEGGEFRRRRHRHN